MSIRFCSETTSPCYCFLFATAIFRFHHNKSSNTNAHLKQLRYLSTGEVFLRVVGVHVSGELSMLLS